MPKVRFVLVVLLVLAVFGSRVCQAGRLVRAATD